MAPLVERKLHALREIAKQSKDFSAVDALRAKIGEANFAVMMSKDNVSIRPEMGFDINMLEALK